MSRIPKVVLLLESSRSSGRAMLKGVADYAHHQGPWSFYWETGGLETARTLLRTLEADGIIARDGEHLDEILKLGVPAVIVGHRRKEISGVVNVITDSPHIGRLGAEHLIQCGFRHFAYVGVAGTTGEPVSWSQVREDNFAARLRDAGFASNHYLLRIDAGRNWAHERAALGKWLASLPKPVGVMACNDDCGVQVMEACKSAGLAVPDAVGVVGADNDELVCGLANPDMSSVAVNFERAGFDAAAALADMMTKRKLVSHRINVPAIHVVTRRSTDIVAVGDLQLARAMKYIKINSRRAVSVTEVAQAAGLSRRALERRFRAELGRSILEHMRKVRTDHICRMLIETTLPVSHIAELLGFEDLQHFARYFRSAHQMSPLDYRKTNLGRVQMSSAQNVGQVAQAGVVDMPRFN